MTDNTLTLIVSLFSVIGAAVAVFVSLRKAGHENANLDADAVGKYAEAASKTAERVTALEFRVTDLQAQIDKQAQVINDQRAIIDELKVGIDRLTGQIKSLGHAPVWTLDNLRTNE